MIEFCGVISKECQKRYEIREFLAFLIGLFICSSPLLVPFLVFAIVKSNYFLIILIACIYCAILLISVAEALSVKKKLPVKILIADERIEIENKVESKNNPLSEVNYVNDYGKWYQVFFKIGFGYRYIICQKDLITQGTIEDFEKIFEGKIVRKYKDK